MTTIITLCWVSFFFTCFYHYFVNSLRMERCCVYFCVPNAQSQGLEEVDEGREGEITKAADIDEQLHY